ncbi:MAG: N-acetyltransferase family protein [Solirubrobacteraceae bacterium]
MDPRQTATLRHADPARDGGACAAIYAPYVDASAISFEQRAPDAARFAARIAAGTRTHPWLVLEDGGQIAAFAYASQHRTRAAYRWAAEVGIYVDPAHRRSGAGRRLYEALFELLRRQNLRIACAGITLPNEPSIGLHLALGFEPVGIQHAIGWKNGAWHDVSWWQLRLAPDDDSPPAEPLGPQRLPG